MSWSRTGDPLTDFENYDAEQARELAKLPVCEYCDEPIQAEEYCDIDGTIICPDCFRNEHIKKTEDYIE